MARADREKAIMKGLTPALKGSVKWIFMKR